MGGWLPALPFVVNCQNSRLTKMSTFTWPGHVLLGEKNRWCWGHK